MTVRTNVHRIYEFRDPEPLRVEIHDPDCPCCAPPEDRTLSFVDLGMLAWWGMVAGSATAFAISPAGAAHALLTALGLGR